MKKRVLPFLILIMISFVISARIEIHDIDFKTSYFAGEKISGKINVSITNEDLDLEISAEKQKITLETFLKENGVAYDCEPYDCSNDYKAEEGLKDKTFNVSSKEIYAGFYITGDEIEVTKIDFDLSSNFATSTTLPLEMKFFEKFDWRFSQFSTEYNSYASTGCFIEEEKTQGPLIATSTYCEEVTLQETNSIKAGVNLVNKNSDDKQLKILVYPKDGTSEVGSCTITNPSASTECIVNAMLEDTFPEGNYSICVKAQEEPTNYQLFESPNSKGCGFIYPRKNEDPTKDYSVYAKTAKYSDASRLSKSSIKFDELTEIADSLIEERYDRNCSSGCKLPIKISGINQNLRFFDIGLYYLREGDRLEEKIYSLEKKPAEVSFNGILDLEMTNFTMDSQGKYRLYFGSKKIIDEEIEIIPAPTILSVYPTNAPAGIPVNFTAIVEYEDSKKDITYTWKFQNSTEKKTNEPHVLQTLNEIKDYKLILEVSAGGNFTSKKEFIIHAQNPKDAINATINLKKKALENAIKEINVLPAWYQKGLKDYLNITSYQDDLKYTEDTFKRIYKDESYVELAKNLYAIDVPSSIRISESMEFPLLTEISQIDPQVISTYSGSVSEDLNEYKNPILSWQTENIDSLIKSQKIELTKFSGEKETVLNAYEALIKSKSGSESFIVINSPLTALYFSEGNEGFKNVEGSSIAILDSQGEKNFKFYTLGEQESSMFVSPKLSSLAINIKVEPCNFNFICEPEEGENSKNCRSDCKPAGKMVFYILIIILVAVLVYSAIQIWYKNHYEEYLFEDKRQMYNLIMFVTNAKEKGMKDSEIKKSLTKQGWSSERINYVIRKSNGKNTTLPEIIPFEHIAAFFRTKKIKKGFATNNWQQQGANFNKHGFQ